MKPQCAKAVADFLGREPTKGELDGIETRLQSSMKELRAKDPNAWATMSRDERISAGAKLARQKTVADTTRAHANTLRDIEIKQNQLDKLESFKAGTGKGKGQLAALRQRAIYHAQQIGGDTSVEIDRKAIFNDLTRQLDYKTGGKGKFWGMVQDPTEQRQLMRAIWGEKTGNPDVDASAKAIHELNEQAFQRANDAGININRLENYHVPQPWAWEKVGADRAGFVKDAMAEIDPNQYTNVDGSAMTRDQIQKMVEKSAETLGTNGSNKRGEKQGTGNSGTVGGSRNAPRQLHFSSAEGYMRMMEKYGSADSVYSMLDHHYNGIARDIAAAKKFGRDADNFFPQLVEKAFANDALAASGKSPEAKAKALLQLEKLKNTTLKEWQAFRSPDHPGTMPLWAKISQNIRGVASATLLGSSTISAIPDLQMAVGYAHLRGMARTKVLANVLEGLKPTTENRQRIARLGIVADTLHHSVNRMGTEDIGSKAVRFMNQAVHNISGLRAWDRGMTHGVAASMMDMFGDHVSKTNHADLAPTDKAYMDRFGITADHWNTWKQADLDKGPNGNHSMLTPDGIYGIDDAKLAPMAQARLAARNEPSSAEAQAREIRNLKSDAAEKLLSATLSETHIGARGGSGSSIADQVALGLDPGAKGTLKHEIASWLFLLKQTPLGIFKTHMLDVPNGLQDWKSAWLYRAKFMAGSAALGAVAQELKDVVLGQDPENLMTPKGLAKIMLASGGLGMYGDFALGDKGDHQNGALAKLLGPGATMAEDAINLFQNAKGVATNSLGMVAEPGEQTVRPDQLAAQTARFVRSYAVPFSRVWYLKAAFNHLIYDQVMNNLSPGYSARVQNRMVQKNQSSWWQSGELTPSRAPDLGVAAGQPAQ